MGRFRFLRTWSILAETAQPLKELSAAAEKFARRAAAFLWRSKKVTRRFIAGKTRFESCAGLPVCPCRARCQLVISLRNSLLTSALPKLKTKQGLALVLLPSIPE